MSEQRTEHGAFTLERLIDAPPARVYGAFATADGKARWFGGPQMTVLAREFDFRVGGRDRLYCQWQAGAHRNRPEARTSDFRAEYLDIVPERRVVYVYEMYLDAKKISVSLATVQFDAHAAGTRLAITEQGVFLDGYRDEGSRQEGTEWLVGRMVDSLAVPDQPLHNRELTLSRMVFAPRELVFRAWTDPQQLARWFGPAGFTVPHCQADARVGGRWALTMRANDSLEPLVGRDHHAGGEYLHVEPPTRLVFTNNALDAHGNVILEGITTILFEDVGGATRMTVHTRAGGAGASVPAMLGGMEQGWSESLLKLGRFLTPAHTA